MLLSIVFHKKSLAVCVEQGLLKQLKWEFSPLLYSVFRQGDGILKGFDTSISLFFINYCKLTGGQNDLWLNSC